MQPTNFTKVNIPQLNTPEPKRFRSNYFCQFVAYHHINYAVCNRSMNDSLLVLNYITFGLNILNYTEYMMVYTFTSIHGRFGIKKKKKIKIKKYKLL